MCNTCLIDIKKNKLPKKSHINLFKFANFPKVFIESLKRQCQFKENPFREKTEEDSENYEREALKLNKLEAYLLKLIIPFVRIAHCPRGPYFKVKGDLILISSDIDHSLTKILPLQQSLIPVCFKRKLSYSGSYLEEFVDKQKIKMYFAWFKKNNHLFKNIDLDANLIDDFFAESLEATKNFESITKEDDVIYLSDEEDTTNVESNSETFFNSDIDESFQHSSTSDETGWTHNQTTMFLNKYCENINLPSVANKMADIIVDYETSKQIPIENEDDFDVDEEIITEEEFLRNVDQELDKEIAE